MRKHWALSKFLAVDVSWLELFRNGLITAWPTRRWVNGATSPASPSSRDGFASSAVGAIYLYSCFANFSSSVGAASEYAAPDGAFIFLCEKLQRCRAYGAENVPAIIFDRNSPVRFDEPMLTKASQKQPCMPPCTPRGLPSVSRKNSQRFPFQFILTGCIWLICTAGFSSACAQSHLW